MMQQVHDFSTALGALRASFDDEGMLLALSFVDAVEHRLAPAPHVQRVETELTAYADGQCRTFTIPVRPSGTEFQQRVWQELQRIPFGETISYGHLATRLGQPDAVRAVGGANSRNPVAIVIPCHRVIGADGTLTGYAGGLDKKRALLALERSVIQPALFT